MATPIKDGAVLAVLEKLESQKTQFLARFYSQFVSDPGFESLVDFELIFDSILLEIRKSLQISSRKRM